MMYHQMLVLSLLYMNLITVYVYIYIYSIIICMIVLCVDVLTYCNISVSAHIITHRCVHIV